MNRHGDVALRPSCDVRVVDIATTASSVNASGVRLSTEDGSVQVGATEVDLERGKSFFFAVLIKAIKANS